MGQFIDAKPVRPEDGIPRDALLDDLYAFENHIRNADNWRGELWTFGGMVHTAPLSDVPGLRRHSLVIAEDASRAGALADVAAIRARVQAMPPNCGVL